MTDTEKAMRDFELSRKDWSFARLCGNTGQAILSALREKAERDKGCGCPCGETDQTFCETCNRIRVQAIKEKLDRDNPKPLTLEELEKEINGPDYIHGWIKEDGKPVPALIDTDENGLIVGIWCSDQNDWYEEKDYGTKWVFYLYEPKEDA